MSKEKNENLRYVAKVAVSEGQHGKFNKIIVDNPNPLTKDGEPNKYYQGNLFWVDSETGKSYLVKQMSVKGVSQKAREHGFVQSLVIDLGSEYHVQEQE